MEIAFLQRFFLHDFSAININILSQPISFSDFLNRKIGNETAPFYGIDKEQQVIDSSREEQQQKCWIDKNAQQDYNQGSSKENTMNAPALMEMLIPVLCK